MAISMRDHFALPLIGALLSPLPEQHDHGSGPWEVVVDLDEVPMSDIFCRFYDDIKSISILNGDAKEALKNGDKEWYVKLALTAEKDDIKATLKLKLFEKESVVSIFQSVYAKINDQHLKLFVWLYARDVFKLGEGDEVMNPYADL
ncbi:unnamed protein product [Cylindrotheca closterium]|uniref:Uncharacterized protein n=1 Tax=Cylindrotheca closterium TaxID=2856 RepID=A0AAD2CM84_9STRA|nr:unnamed protein product [Cylindrotheca closterium]